MSLITSIRDSSLAADCTKRWAVDHVELRPILEELAGEPARQLRQHVGRPFGTAVHAGSANLNRALMDTGEVGGQKRRIAAAEWAIEDFHQQLTGDDDYDEQTPGQDTAIEQIGRLVGEVHALQRPDAMPALVEEQIEADIAGIRTTGHPDAWIVGGVLDDYKSGKRAPAPAIHGRQQGAYAMTLAASDRPVHKARLTWLPRTKTPRPVEQVELILPVVERLAFARIAELRGAVDLLSMAIDGSAKLEWHNRFPLDTIPENPVSRLCSARFCPAFGTEICQSWKLKE